VPPWVEHLTRARKRTTPSHSSKAVVQLRNAENEKRGKDIFAKPAEAFLTVNAISSSKFFASRFSTSDIAHEEIRPIETVRFITDSETDHAMFINFLPAQFATHCFGENFC
jgi:hypothetical protein